MTARTLLVAVLLALTAATAAQAEFSSTPDTTSGASGQIRITGDVEAIAVGPTRVFVGGRFTTVTKPDGSTVARRNLLAISRTTGQLDLGFNPGPDQEVTALAASGSTVFAGGNFSTIGGVARSRVARLDQATGQVTAFDPQLSGTVKSPFTTSVRTLAVSGSTVYVGGSFGQVGAGATGQSGPAVARRGLARLDQDTGKATPFDPGVDDYVDTAVVTGSAILVGGNFTQVAAGTTGQPGTPVTRNRLAALDPDTGRATPWDPNLDGMAIALAVSGQTVYAGGTFTSVGGVTRNRLAAIDRDTGQAATFDPNLPAAVDSLAVSGGRLYVQGQFDVQTSAGRRIGFIAYRTDTGAITSTAPVTSQGLTISALATDGPGRLYVGCPCSTIGPISTGFARFTDASVATAVGWRGGQAKALRRGVRLTWATGAEQDLLGFDVVRVRRGVRTKVNGTLIAASALTTSRSGGSGYTFTDRGGRPRDRYRIVAVDLDGARSSHALRARR